MNKQALITSLLILIIVGLLGVVVFGSKNKNLSKVSSGQVATQPSSDSYKTPIFFYGNTCPHCAEVETWMEENKIKEKINVIKKEVYDNQQNAKELTQAAQDCGLPTDSIGVPFLYDEGKCFIGTPDVTKYLSEKAGIKNASSSAERSTL